MDYDFVDLHVHSEFSACAEDVSVEWWGEIARTTGDVFALTDHSSHLFFPPERAWVLWSDDADEMFEACQETGPDRVREYLRYVRSVQCGRMMIGVELDILSDGRVVYVEELLPTLDLVLGAVHAMATIRHERPLDEVEAEFRFQVEVFAGLGVPVLVHPFRAMLSAKYPVSDDLIAWTVDVAADAGLALEINSHKLFPDHDLAMVRLAVERGARLIVGSDAHRRDEYRDFDYQADILARAGVDPSGWEDVRWLPTLPALEAAAGA